MSGHQTKQQLIATKMLLLFRKKKKEQIFNPENIFPVVMYFSLFAQSPDLNPVENTKTN